jgi:methylated-DNA-[protein]-cysteine S-methyltransferase
MIKSRLFYNSPIGALEIVGTNDGIENIIFVHLLNDIRSCCPGLNTLTSFTENSLNKNLIDFPEPIKDCVKQLDEYFDGKRKDFHVKLNPNGTEFQHKIWGIVADVTFGKTSTYQEIARRYGDVKSVRAVGNANSKNPIPIIIPCHRIIGTNGKLTGYAGGLLRKQWLLTHESNLEQNLFL